MSWYHGSVSIIIIIILFPFLFIRDRTNYKSLQISYRNGANFNHVCMY